MAQQRLSLSFLTELRNMSKKVAIVTGANRGIGFETALGLAKKNLSVIMADKADQTASKIRITQETGNRDVTAEHLDLASFKSVRSFASNVIENHDRLDILLNNAGVFCQNKQRTIDGIDGVMQINHLGPFLLTHTLLDLLKQTAGSRIVFVTSSGCFYHQLQPKLLKHPDYFTPHFISGAVHYYNTKMCTMIAAKELSKRLHPWNVTSNCLHPGMTNTDFLLMNHEKSAFQTRMVKKAMGFFLQDQKYSADLSVFLATSETVKNVTGKYFVNYQVHRGPAMLENEDVCREVWRESEDLVGLSHF